VIQHIQNSLQQMVHCSHHSIMQHQCHLLHNKLLGYRNLSVYGTGEMRR
jgi:hypothetical protein